MVVANFSLKPKDILLSKNTLDRDVPGSFCCRRLSTLLLPVLLALQLGETSLLSLCSLVGVVYSIRPLSTSLTGRAASQLTVRSTSHSRPKRVGVCMYDMNLSARCKRLFTWPHPDAHIDVP